MDRARTRIAHSEWKARRKADRTRTRTACSKLAEDRTRTVHSKLAKDMTRMARRKLAEDRTRMACSKLKGFWGSTNNLLAGNQGNKLLREEGKKKGKKWSTAP